MKARDHARVWRDAADHIRLGTNETDMGRIYRILWNFANQIASGYEDLAKEQEEQGD